MLSENTSYIRRKSKRPGALTNFFGKIFLEQKLNNWFGWILIIGLAVVFGYLIATKTIIGLGLLGAVIGSFLVIVCLLNTEAGLYINLIYAFLACQFSRMFFHDTFPIGV